MEKKPKKLLILTANYGQGHNSVARVIETAFRAKKSNWGVEILEIAQKISPQFAKTSQYTYQKAIIYSPKVYETIIRLLDKPRSVRAIGKMFFLVNKRRLIKLVEQKKPDLFLVTFPGWTQIIAHSDNPNVLNIPIISVITDSIKVHLFWLSPRSSFYISANPDTTQTLQKMGIDPKYIKTFGYPVNNQLYTRFNRRALVLKKLRLDPTKKSLLILPSSGITTTQLTIKKIRQQFPDLNIIVILGRNSEFLPVLKKLFQVDNNLALIGWTDDFISILQSIDVVISKAGGSTVMEAITAKKPIIINKVIAGQEEGNAELVKRHGLGIITSQDPKDILRALKNIFKNEKKFKTNLEKFKNPNSARKIVDFIIKNY